jgi:hypothetical protein
MKLIALRRYPALSSALLLLFLLMGCSDSGTGVEDELAPLVGSWRAQALLLTNQADPQEEFDVIGSGGVFALSILATGTYSASLTVFGMSNVEMGTITVSGNQLTITPTNPPGSPTQGTWSLSGDVLYIDGTTEFDFDLDGSGDPANVHFELNRVDS